MKGKEKSKEKGKNNEIFLSCFGSLEVDGG